MFEIELKAHVTDRKALLEKLEGFAEYAGSVRRDDTYWKFYRPDGKKISARIRSETPADTGEIKAENPVKKALFLTYKHKEVKKDCSGAAVEVNDEKECEISDRTAVEALLKDTGFVFSHSKTKTVVDFKFQDATIELCTVEKLGDFAEIEILSPSDEAETVKKYQSELKEILKKCGIPESQIEERYYSDMLKELEKGSHC